MLWKVQDAERGSSREHTLGTVTLRSLIVMTCIFWSSLISALQSTNTLSRLDNFYNYPLVQFLTHHVFAWYRTQYTFFMMIQCCIPPASKYINFQNKCMQNLYGKEGPSANQLTLDYAPPEAIFGRLVFCSWEINELGYDLLILFTILVGIGKDLLPLNLMLGHMIFGPLVLFGLSSSLAHHMSLLFLGEHLTGHT